MNQLLQGIESREKIARLLAMTKIVDGPKVDAIYYHLVGGCGQSRAAVTYGVKQSKLSEALTTLNAVAEHCEKYHELKVYQPDSDAHRNKRVLAIMAEWQRGCSCAIDDNPEECEECTEGALSAINKLFGA